MGASCRLFLVRVYLSRSWRIPLGSSRIFLQSHFGWSLNVTKLLQSQKETIGQGHKQLFARKIVQKCSVIQQTNQKLNNAVRCQDILLNTVQIYNCVKKK